METTFVLTPAEASPPSHCFLSVFSLLPFPSPPYLPSSSLFPLAEPGVESNMHAKHLFSHSAEQEATYLT